MIATRTCVSAFVMSFVLIAAGCSGAAHQASPLPSPPPPASPARNPFQRSVAARAFTLTLTGANAVPPAAGHSFGAAAVDIGGPGDRVCWKISGLHGVPAPLYAYIHRGQAGTAGPVVVPLGAGYAPAGCVTGIAPALLVQIERRPGGYYLAIGDRQHPAGAVRAQL